MEELIPDAGLVILEGGSHFAYLEQADRFSSVLSSEDKETLLKEARTASGWIYKEIKKICEGKPA